MESIYKYTTTELSGAKEEIFEISTGVRQGGPESPTLFNLYMDFVMRVFLQRAKGKNINNILQKSVIRYQVTLQSLENGSDLATTG